MQSARFMLLLSLIACAPDWADPVLNVESIQIADMNLLGATLDVELSAYNPNSDPLPFEEVEYEIRIGNSSPMRGRAVFDVPLAAMDNTPLSTTIHIPATAAISVVQELGEGNASYQITGTMTLVYHGRRRVAFEREGQLSDLISGRSGQPD
jgi:hypothetical protein